jgi:hypothetical protein
MTYSFVFVCQQGPLEVQAMLLAASLRQNARADHQLVAAVPTPEARWGRPRAETVRFLGDLGVEMAPIVNEIDADYPIGNKVSSLLLDLAGDVTVFVDSDVLCLRPFAGLPEIEGDFCAKPADGYAFGRHGEHDAEWRKIYRSVDLPVPSARMVATVSGEVMPPYFNSGFVAVRRGVDLGRAWLACCRRIDADRDVRYKRPWLDQIALPVAVARLGLEYRCLDERFNYPCHRRRIDPRDPPYFAHYHWPEVLLRDRVLWSACRALARQYPPLAEALRWYPGWRPLLHPSAVIAACAGPRRLSHRIATLARRLRRRLRGA